jgi:hypothetical protein
MKTNYFTHKLFPTDGAVLCESLKVSFDSMIANSRNTATLGNEYHVIQHLSGDVYTFIKTNSRDVFRKLDTSSNICVDLSNILNQNEKIAFASFFILKGDLVGFSNTLYSPRIGKLAEIYDATMFSRNNNHNINFDPITNMVTEQDVMNFAHVGKITMKMDKTQSILSGFGTLFSGNVTYDDVDSFEIKIIPKRSKDIKDTFSDLMQGRPQGVNSVAVSAKEHIGDVATDLNVIMSNTVCDLVVPNSATAIELQMETNYTNNTTLRNLGY